MENLLQLAGWPGDVGLTVQLRALEVLDHCAIYVLIAGCYSPFLTFLFHGAKPQWAIALQALRLRTRGGTWSSTGCELLPSSTRETCGCI